MLMTPAKLIALRLFNLTLGRSDLASRGLRRLLVRLLVTGRSRGYCQSARFFSPVELDGGPTEEAARR